VEVRLEVENPNDFALPTGHLDYDLSLAGISVARASSYALATVPGRGRAVVVVPVRFSTVGAAAGALSGALGGRTDVALTGAPGTARSRSGSTCAPRSRGPPPASPRFAIAITA